MPEGWKNGRKRHEGIAWEEGASTCGKTTQKENRKRERDEVCVTQFCVLMEDSTAISSAAFLQHHHRDGELGKSEKR